MASHPVRGAARRAAKAVALRIPALREVHENSEALRREIDRLNRHVADLNIRLAPDEAVMFVPPGHFYSAIPSQKYVHDRAEKLFGPPPRTLPGIDLREAQQIELLSEFERYYVEQPFPVEANGKTRYHLNNPAFSYPDGLILYSMLRHVKPKRIVEIGSGYSSCATLDTNELFFGNSIDCTFVEPYPQLLKSLLRPGDEERIRIIPADAQDCDASLFTSLEANDVLFIDSTHVSKIGSDVNRLFFEVLPALAPGVVVHIHDIFYPFEYPMDWIYQGRAWTEAYLLRALLMGSGAFEVVLFNHFIQTFHRELLEQKFPLALGTPAGSIWLRKTA